MGALIHSLSRDELAGVCQDMGMPRYRAKQLWHWLYRKRATGWESMQNLPREFRARLASAYSLTSAQLAGPQESSGDSLKILARLQDDNAVEVVVILGQSAHPRAGEDTPRSRRTVCISSQVGCRFHCAFCASGQAGFARNLEAGEIVGQVLLAGECLEDKPTHVVYMGIGEPLDNYDDVLKSIRILNDSEGLNIGARRITVSTCGIVPGIRRLSGEGLQVELSVSLHAPNDRIRARLMPVNARYPLAQLLPACREYADRTGRIVTFEYTLIRGMNDTPDHAAELCRRLRDVHCRVNLIPLSPVEEFDGEISPPANTEAFVAQLENVGLNVTLRRSKGSRIRAACGQLRYGGACQ